MKRVVIVVLLILAILAMLLLALCPKPNPGKPVPAGQPHDPAESTQEIIRGAD